MVLRKINNILLILIIICSTGFYEISILGPLKRISEFLGLGLIIVLLVFHIVYGEQKRLRYNFVIPIVLILISLITSMLMAKYVRSQSITDTLIAQSSMYYYLLYFLMHQLRIEPKDLERIFIGFGILYVALYLIQFYLYPRIIFDAYVRFDRGTIRIYLNGSAYLSFAYLIYLQGFLRFNHLKTLIWIFIFFSIFILSGGRQTLSIMVLAAVVFVISDKKIKSRIVLLFLGLVGTLAIYFIFQDIFQSLITKARYDASLGHDYIRLRAANFFLTDFFKNTFSYITGNGMFAPNSSYGKEISQYTLEHQFYLADIGIVGNYAIYGLFFLLGVTMIFYKAFKMNLLYKYTYLKYLFGVILLSILTGGAFSQGHFICFIVCVMYLLDVSSYTIEIENNGNQ